MEQEQLVADEIICALVAEKLKSEAVQQQGYVITGAPRTRTQAREMKRTGFMPKHVSKVIIPLHEVLLSYSC
jgi:adenylate kinase family enzyme